MAALALVASLVAGTVVAAPTVASAAEPTGTLDQRFEHPDAMGLDVGTTYGQTFTAGRSGLLTAISLQWWAPEAGDVVLSVQAAPGGVRQGPVLGTATISTRGGWQTAEFGWPVRVEAGSTYAFTFPGVRVGVGVGGPSLGADYPGGTFIEDGYPWAHEYDMVFRTYVSRVLAPSDLRAVGVDGAALLSWTARYGDGRVPIEAWQVQYALAGTGAWVSGGTLPPMRTAGATIRGLENGTTYDVRVRGVDATGEGDWTLPVTVTPVGDVRPGESYAVGRLAVGESLTVATRDWTPSTTVTTAVWQVAGVTVSTADTWTPAPADLGRPATLVVTGTAPGHRPASRTVELGPVSAGTVQATVALRDPSGATQGETPVGVPLTAAVDVARPLGADVSYAWSVTSGLGETTRIEGVTGDTWTPTGSLVARSDTVDVTVTISSPGYDALVRRTSRALTTGTQQGAVSLDRVAVGAPATAVVTGVPADATATHVWRVDGTAVPGATGASYVPAPDQVGHELTVEVTTRAPGYHDRVLTTGATIDPGTQQGAVAVVGTPTVGVPLTAEPSGWLTGTTYSYAWSVDGVPVVGATGASFTPGPEALGRSVTVAVTAALPGYLPASAASAPGIPVAPGTQTGTVAVVGSATAGETLVAVGDGFLPGTTLRHQWLRDGVPVAGEVDDEHVVTEDDLGSRLSVVVLATLDGYATAQAQSEPTAVVLGTVPTLPLPAEPVATGAGQPFEYRVPVTGTPAPTLTLRGTLPPGISFDAGTGVVSGRSTVAGTWPVDVVADNGVGVPVVTPLVVVVEAGPTDELALVTTGTTVDDDGVLHAPQGSTITVRGLGLDEWSNVTGGLPVTLTSSVATDVVDGETVTFPHASPHTITATSGAFRASVLVEVVPTATGDEDGTPGAGTPGPGAGAGGPGQEAPGGSGTPGAVVPGSGPGAGAAGAVAGAAVTPARSGAVALTPTAARHDAQLAHTGGDAGGALLAAGLLLVLGAGVRLGARRRRRA